MKSRTSSLVLEWEAQATPGHWARFNSSLPDPWDSLTPKILLQSMVWKQQLLKKCLFPSIRNGLTLASKMAQQVKEGTCHQN